MSWCDQGKSLLAQQAIDCALTQSGAAETLTELNTFIDVGRHIPCFYNDRVIPGLLFSHVSVWPDCKNWQK